jgi:hypothetical protein
VKTANESTEDAARFKYSGATRSIRQENEREGFLAFGSKCFALRVVLDGCETWSLKSAEKHGPNIYENRVSGKSLVSTNVEVK